MELKLNFLSANFLTVGKSSDKDLFDAHGRLLLAKGKLVSPTIMELLVKRKLYILEYEWNNKQSPKESFSPELYQRILGSMQRIFCDAHLFSSKNLLATMKIVDGIIIELEKSGGYVDFNHFRTHDNYTYVHSINVALIATLIALQIGYQGNYLRNLCLGALLHDLGKLMIPSSILNKPSGLTPEEFEIVKRHPIQGQYMLQNVSVPSEVLFSIRQHHERWNGQGYPDRLMKRGIHQSAQIVAVADVFDALTADRPYRKGLPPYHAFEMVVACSDKDFNPKVVQAFRESLNLYPENAIVTLNTGEVGVVVAVPIQMPTRPLVRLLFDSNGVFIHRETFVDLLQDLTRFIGRIEFKEVG